MSSQLNPNFELNNIQITPDQFLKAELEWGISLENQNFVNLSNETLKQFNLSDYLKEEGVKTCMDFGAGTGAYTLASINAGFDTYTFEIWDAHKNYMKERITNLQLIDKPIQTDLMLFIEVAEHMTDKEIKSLFKKIQPKYILFSSTSGTTDFDVEWGHINIKSQTDWIDFWYDLGYELNRKLNLPTEWSKLFRLL